MRRPLRHVGRPASLSQSSQAPRTGRHLDLTFAAGVRAFATGRSRRVLGRQGALLALRRGRVATRGLCIRSRSGLRAAMRVLEPVGAAGRHLKLTLHVPVARGLRINRHSAQAGLDGRGHGSLVGVLGFHLDLADSRRSAARERTVRRPKALRTRGARSRSRVLRTKRIGDSATDGRRKAQPRPGPPDRQKRLARARNRKKTPVPSLARAAEAGSAP
jgi:hypothetical protein